MIILILDDDKTAFLSDDYLTGSVIGRSLNNSVDGDYEVVFINNTPNPAGFVPTQLVTNDQPVVQNYKRFYVRTPTKTLSFIRTEILFPVFIDDQELGLFLNEAVFPPLPV